NRPPETEKGGTFIVLKPPLGHGLSTVPQPYGSSRQRLRAAQVREQVTYLLIAQVLQRLLRHHRAVGLAHISDRALLNQDVLPIDAAQHHHPVVLIGQETIDHAAALRFDDVVLKSFTDLRTRIDDVHQQPIEVAALVGRQVWPNLAALAKERVALAAV